MFSARELLKIAISVEKEGEEFYRRLGERFQKPDIKEFFLFMSREEAEHARIFERIGDMIGANEEVYLNMEEAEPFLRSYVEGRFFPSFKTMEEYLRDRSVEEAIDFSISLEKETIIFYYEISETLKNEKAKNLVRVIIQQEKGHVSKLLKVKGLIG